MQVIRCTGKLLKEMGLKKADLCETEPDFSSLGPWHANLFYINRRKCLIFVNDKTLFNFIVPDVRKAQIKDLAGLFRGYLQTVLAEEGIPEMLVQKILSEYTEIGYATTNSKSVLGSMNDLVSHYKFHVMEEGGVHSTMVPTIIKELNRMPMGAIGYHYPIEALTQWVQQRQTE